MFNRPSSSPGSPRSSRRNQSWARRSVPPPPRCSGRAATRRSGPLGREGVTRSRAFFYSISIRETQPAQPSLYITHKLSARSVFLLHRNNGARRRGRRGAASRAAARRRCAAGCPWPSRPPTTSRRRASSRPRRRARALLAGLSLVARHAHARAAHAHPLVVAVRWARDSGRAVVPGEPSVAEALPVHALAVPRTDAHPGTSLLRLAHRPLAMRAEPRGGALACTARHSEARDFAAVPTRRRCRAIAPVVAPAATRLYGCTSDAFSRLVPIAHSTIITPEQSLFYVSAGQPLSR